MNHFFRLRALLRRSRLGADMADELRAHIETQTQRNLASGMSPEEAHAAAHRQFGSMTQIQERARDGRRFMWVENLVRDAGFAVRTLLKSPGFTSVVVLTLALGLGVNTVLFTWFNVAAFRPLPVPDPGLFPKGWLIGHPKLASRIFAVGSGLPQTALPKVAMPILAIKQETEKTVRLGRVELASHLRSDRMATFGEIDSHGRSLTGSFYSANATFNIRSTSFFNTITRNGITMALRDGLSIRRTRSARPKERCAVENGLVDESARMGAVDSALGRRWQPESIDWPKVPARRRGARVKLVGRNEIMPGNPAVASVTHQTLCAV